MNETYGYLDVEDLLLLKKHYDARLPEDVRLVPVPAHISTAAAQVWLLQNILEPEKLLEKDIRNESPVGATPWRKAFWKRVISQIETEIAQQSDTDVRIKILPQLLRDLTMFL